MDRMAPSRKRLIRGLLGFDGQEARDVKGSRVRSLHLCWEGSADGGSQETCLQHFMLSFDMHRVNSESSTR